MATELGRLGVWAWLDAYTAPEAAAFAKRLEDWGYGALWIPEAVGRDPFSLIGYLAAHTESLVFATGIANIYARDAMTLKAVHKTLSEIAPGRFVLGLGVSHEHLVTQVRGHDYKKPLSTMRAHLEAMEAALYMGKEPESDAPIVLGALRDGMLGLAASRTQGAHPYLVPPAHTERARKVMGPDAWLCPEQMVLSETNPETARAIARTSLQVYLGLPNYRNNLQQFGFSETDFENRGSDRLVDEIVAWGDTDAIRNRIQAHWEAGADHVCIQTLRSDGQAGPDEALLEALAPARG